MSEKEKEEMSKLPEICENCNCKLEYMKSLFADEMTAVCINCDAIYEIEE
jgi:superfamily II DNA helicase RecQ